VFLELRTGIQKVEGQLGWIMDENKNNIFLLLTAEAHSLPAKSSVSLHPQLKIFPFSPFP